MSHSLDIDRTSEASITPNSDSHMNGLREWPISRTSIEPDRINFIEAQIATFFDGDNNNITEGLMKRDRTTNLPGESQVDIGNAAAYSCDGPPTDQAPNYKPYPLRDWYQGLVLTAIIALLCLTAIAVGFLPDERTRFAPFTEVGSNNVNSVNHRGLAIYDNNQTAYDTDAHSNDPEILKDVAKTVSFSIEDENTYSSTSIGVSLRVEDARSYAVSEGTIGNEYLRRDIACTTMIYIGGGEQPTQDTSSFNQSQTGAYECVQSILSWQDGDGGGCAECEGGDRGSYINIGVNTITVIPGPRTATNVAATIQDLPSTDDDSVATVMQATEIPAAITIPKFQITTASKPDNPKGDITEHVSMVSNTITIAPTDDLPTIVATTAQGLSSTNHNAAEDPQKSMQFADEGEEITRDSVAVATGSDNAPENSSSADVDTSEAHIGSSTATMTDGARTAVINGSPTTITESARTAVINGSPTTMTESARTAVINGSPTTITKSAWTTTTGGSPAGITVDVRTTVIGGLTATMTGGVLTAILDGSLTTVSQGLSTNIIDALVLSTFTTVTTNSDGTPTTQLVYVADSLVATSTGSQEFQTRTAVTLVTDLPATSTFRFSSPTSPSTATPSSKPISSDSTPTSTAGPGTAILQVYVVTEGQYFVGLVLPTLLSTFLAIPLRIMDFNVKLYRPFHNLLSKDGTKASRSLLLPTTGLSSYLCASDKVTRLNGGLIILSAILIPISAEAVLMVLHRGDGCQSGKGNANNCAMTLGISPIPAYVTIAILSLMGFLIILVWFQLRKYRTGVPGKPWNLTFMSKFSSDPKIHLLVSKLSADTMPLKQKDLLRVFEPWLYIIEAQTKATGGYRVTVLDKSDSQERDERKKLISQENPEETKIQSGRFPAAPSFILTPCGRILVLLFITGVLGLLAAYERSRPGNGFEDFMDSENIGVRLLFSGIGVALTLIWAAFFQGKMHMSPSRRLMLIFINRYRLHQPIQSSLERDIPSKSPKGTRTRFTNQSLQRLISRRLGQSPRHISWHRVFRCDLGASSADALGQRTFSDGGDLQGTYDMSVVCGCCVGWNDLYRIGILLCQSPQHARRS
ncbi:hypothetical protein G7054_g10605 [Neopestalotiopsis clavispora]|nr:hypothetical protein G7054_g10605 [Neopestalotiopsis clavispora]